MHQYNNSNRLDHLSTSKSTKSNEKSEKKEQTSKVSKEQSSNLVPSYTLLKYPSTTCSTPWSYTNWLFYFAISTSTKTKKRNRKRNKKKEKNRKKKLKFLVQNDILLYQSTWLPLSSVSPILQFSLTSNVTAIALRHIIYMIFYLSHDVLAAHISTLVFCVLQAVQ